MNNIKKILSLVVCIYFTAQADTPVEFRVAAFIPTNELFRDMYGSVGPRYQLEVTRGIWCDNLDAWVNLDFFSAKGCTCTCGTSKLLLANINAGPKYYFRRAECFSPYLGAGLALGVASVKNEFYCTDKEIAATFGIVLKSGIDIYTTKNCFIDFFFDYLCQPAFFKQKTVDIGGCTIGLGIGYDF